MKINVKTPVLSAVAFFGTLGILSVGYSAYVSNYPATATAGTSQLSAGEWNKMVTALQTLDTNLSAFTISGGNVGIGGTPTQAFEVMKTIPGWALIAKVTNASNVAGTQARFDLATQTANSYGIVSISENGWGVTSMELASGNGVTNGMWFTNGTTVDGSGNGTWPFVWRHGNSERMRITNNGSVGIGTNSPTWHLEVAKNVPNGYVGITNNNTAAGGVKWTWLNGSTGSPLGAGKMCFETGGICRLNIDSGGNMWATTVTATTVTATSDSRLKTNVETVTGLETVEKLRWVEFDWKSGNGKSSGVIAQELETVLPHLVAVDSSSEKMRSVNYAGLSAYFIEAIKELGKSEKTKQGEIDSLRKDNAALRDELSKMDARISELEKR